MWHRPIQVTPGASAVESGPVPHAVQPLRFVVSDLVRRPGERRVVHADAAADWSLELSRLVAGEPLSITATLEGVSGGIHASGTGSAVVEHTCHRCNAVWREAIEVPFSEILSSVEGADYSLDGDVADLEAPVRDSVLLALPLLPVCRPGCLGLCGRCGADLNTGACAGHEDDTSSPFAGLRQLLQP